MLDLRFVLDGSHRECHFSKPCVMGVINLSPNSFYQALPVHAMALEKAEAMIEAGAAIIDVGAVATNPFVSLNETPSIQAEIDTLIPFIETLSQKNIIISVDTYHSAVMTAAVKAGASMINDQHMLSEENALKTAIALNVPVCLMHHFNSPRQPECCTPAELLGRIKNDLHHAITRCLEAGMKHEHIIIDPGFGGGYFGKSADENFYLLAHLQVFKTLGFPILVGLSRKSMLGGDVANRLPQSIAVATIAAMKGASIVRVHDVKETVDAMRMIEKTLYFTD